jgi:hypothetical protein
MQDHSLCKKNFDVLLLTETQLYLENIFPKSFISDGFRLLFTTSKC